LLVALTVVTAILGLWQWQSRRQEAAQRIAAESKSSLAGASQSRAPDFSLQTPDGETVTLAALRGKVVLLNFWATWCPPCKAEMPDLNNLHRKYAAEHDFVVLGVDFEEDAETVQPFLQQYRLIFPVVLDRDGRVTTKLFGVRPLPTTFIIDREGFVRDAWNGQIASEAMLARLKRVW
jgi:peroxiredoxin